MNTGTVSNGTVMDPGTQDGPASPQMRDAWRQENEGGPLRSECRDENADYQLVPCPSCGAREQEACWTASCAERAEAHAGRRREYAATLESVTMSNGLR